MKRLPVGISSFEVIRGEDYYYVDKTPFVEKLVSHGKYYFLSRPRRFGKSLFVDTLKQAFLGKKGFFRGSSLRRTGIGRINILLFTLTLEVVSFSLQKT